MKKSLLCLSASIMVTFLSCNKDDDGFNIVEVENDASEQVAIDAAVLTKGLLINNATLIEGDVPTPNGQVAFELDTKTQSAFQESGFEINFDAPDNYAGAYIQIKDKDGMIAPDYFDVNNSFKTPLREKIKKHTIFKTSIAKKSENTEYIDVDFDKSIPAGSFCYVICIYDDEGNISNPVEVCVEVEAWGGNPNLVSTWRFIKSIEEGETILLGEEDCFESLVYCDNQEQIEYEECDTITALDMTINADGNYTVTVKEDLSYLDYEESRTSCTLIFDEEDEYTYVSKGKWAFDEEEGRLTLVEFEYSEDGENGTNEYGELTFNGDAEITVNSLIISETESDDDTNYTYEYHFGR